MTTDLRKNRGNAGLSWRKWPPENVSRAVKLIAAGHSKGMVALKIGADIADVDRFIATHPLGLRAVQKMRKRYPDFAEGA